MGGASIAPCDSKGALKGSKEERQRTSGRDEVKDRPARSSRASSEAEESSFLTRSVLSRSVSSASMRSVGISLCSASEGENVRNSDGVEDCDDCDENRLRSSASMCS